VRVFGQRGTDDGDADRAVIKRALTVSVGYRRETVTRGFFYDFNSKSL